MPVCAHRDQEMHRNIEYSVLAEEHRPAKHCMDARASETTAVEKLREHIQRTRTAHAKDGH